MAQVADNASAATAMTSTTISTIAVQTGRTKIVLAVLKHKDKLHLRVQEMEPAITDIGKTLDEALEFEKEHNECLAKLLAKQPNVEELLAQADELISTQQPKREVYGAMADSLGQAWRDLNDLLEYRRLLLEKAVAFHQQVSECNQKLADTQRDMEKDMDSYMGSARDWLQEHQAVRKDILESSMRLLGESQALIEFINDLRRIPAADSRGYEHATSAACHVVEELLENVHDRRRRLEELWQRRRAALLTHQKLLSLRESMDKLRSMLQDLLTIDKRFTTLGTSLEQTKTILAEHHNLEVSAKDVYDFSQQLRRLHAQITPCPPDVDRDFRQLVDQVEKWYLRVDRRRYVLQITEEFYKRTQDLMTHITLAEKSLEKMESQKEQINPQDLANAQKELLDGVKSLAVPVLHDGQMLLERVEEIDASGVTDALQTVQDAVDRLIAKCTAFTGVLAKRSDNYRRFTALYTSLYEWTIHVVEVLLKTHRTLPPNLNGAKDFVDLHEQLHDEITGREPEMESLRTLVGTLVKNQTPQEKTDVKEITDKFAHLSDRWKEISKITLARLEIIVPYADFQKLASRVSVEIEVLRNLSQACNEDPTSEVDASNFEQRLTSLHELINTMQTKASEFFKKSLQADAAQLDVSQAATAINDTLERLQQDLKNFASVTQRSQNMRQKKTEWQQFIEEVQQTITWIIRTERDAFQGMPLGYVGSSQEEARSLQAKVAAFEPSVTEIRTKVEKLVHTAQNTPVDAATAPERDIVVNDLIKVYERLISRIEEYKILLNMAIQFYGRLQELERLMREYEALVNVALPSGSINMDQFVSQHLERRDSISRVYEEVIHLGDGISNRIRQNYPQSINLDTFHQNVKDKRDTWDRLWNQQNQLLQGQLDATQLRKEAEEIRQKILELTEQMNKRKDDMGDSLQGAKRVFEVHSVFVKSVEFVSGRVKNFVSSVDRVISAPEKAAQNPDLKPAKEEIEKLWSAFNRDVGILTKRIELAVKYYEVMEEAEQWYKEATQNLVTCGRKTTECRGPEDANNILTQMENFLKPGEKKQEQRVKTLMEISLQVFGAKGPTRVEYLINKNREVMESFSLISNELFSICENLHSRVVKISRSKSFEEPEVGQPPAKSAKIEDREIPVTVEQPVQPTQPVAQKNQLQPAKFEEKLSDITSPAGNNVVLRCRVSGVPAPVVRWFRDGLPVTNNPDYVISVRPDPSSPGTVISTLTINESFGEDSGLFSCSAENSGALVVTECRLNVLDEEMPSEEMTPPVFLKTPQDAIAIEGSGLQFECQVAGSPRPEVAWYKNGVQLVVGKSKCSIVPPDEQGVTRLIIPNAGVEDQGVYECKATNPRGIATCSITFSSKNKSGEEPPFFTKFLSSISSEIGELVKLECHVSGTPQPDLEWTQNGTVLHDNRNRVIKFDGKVATLAIFEFATKESGTYTCRAKNKLGEATTTCTVDQQQDMPRVPRTPESTPEPTTVRQDFTQITQHTKTTTEHLVVETPPTPMQQVQPPEAPLVQPKPQLTFRPEYVQPLPLHIEISQAEPLKLEAIVQAVPGSEVRWLKNGNIIVANVDIIVGRERVPSNPELDRHFLIINNPQPSDSGKYVCIAKNVEGETPTVCTVQIHPTKVPPKVPPKPVKPEFSQPLPASVAAQIGQPVRLEAVVVHDAQPSQIKWMKNGNILVADVNIVMGKESVKTSTFHQDRAPPQESSTYFLMINNPEPGDSGDYVCIATNDEGETITTCTVVVTETHHLIEGFSEPKATLSQTVPPKPETTETQVRPAPPAPQKSEVSEIQVKPAPPTPPKVSETQVRPAPPAPPKPEVFETQVTLKPEVSETHVRPAPPPPPTAPKPQPTGEHVETTTERISERVERFTPPAAQTPPQVSQKPQMQNLMDHMTITRTEETNVHRYESAPADSEPPRFSELLVDQSVEEGHPLRLKCHVSGSKPLEIKWFKDDVEIPRHSDYVTRYDINTGQCVLEIPEVFAEDAGVFMIQAVNEAGIGKCYCNLKVADLLGVSAESATPRPFSKEIQNPPQFVQLFHDTTVEEAKPVKLECIVSGPNVKVQWFKDGILLNSIEYDIKVNGNKHILSLPHTRPHDTGRYVCQADNIQGKATCSAQLTIRETKKPTEQPPRPVEFPVFQKTFVRESPERPHKQPLEVLESIESFEKVTETFAPLGPVHPPVTAPKPFSIPVTPKKWVPPSQLTQEKTIVRAEQNVSLAQTLPEMQPLVHEMPEFVGAVNVPREPFQQPRGPPITWNINQSNQPPARQSTPPTRARTEILTSAPAPYAASQSELSPPTFPLKLLSKGVRPGEKVVFEARVNGTPTPAVTWFRENTPIKNSTDFHISQHGDLHLLTIPEAFAADSGHYKIRAVNPAGEGICIAELVILEPNQSIRDSSHEFSTTSISPQQAQHHPALGGPPHFVATLHPQRTNEQQRVVLECTVEAAQPFTVQWFRNNIEIKPSPDYQQKQKNGVCTLVIPEAYPEDSGDYSCRVTNSEGSRHTSGFLSVEPSFEPLPKIAPVVFPKSLSQTPIAPKKPKIQSSNISYRNAVSDHSDIEMGEVGIYSPLASRQQQPSSSSQYQQRASYSRTNSSTSGFVADNFEKRLLAEVDYRERSLTVDSEAVSEMNGYPAGMEMSPPRFTQIIAPARAVEGGETQLHARVTGYPTPAITWLKNGQRLPTSSARHHYYHDGEFIGLTIRMALKEDSGNYTVIAENPVGQDSCSGTVTVDEKQRIGLSRTYEQPDIMSHQPAPQRGYREVSNGPRHHQPEEEIYDKSMAPRFIAVPNETSVKEGQMVRLDVRISGRPAPDVLWYRNGVQVTDDWTHKLVVNEGGMHSLMILHTGMEDCGQYTCVAKNISGEVQYSVNVNVEESDRVTAPSFVQKLINRQIKEGETVTMQARAVGMPQPTLTWHKGAREIFAGEYNINTNNGSSTLFIESAGLDDADWYMCSARNSAGTSSTKGKLLIEPLPRDLTNPGGFFVPRVSRRQEEPEQPPETVNLRPVTRTQPSYVFNAPDALPDKPSFTSLLSDLELYEFDRAHFESCLIPIGDGTLRVEWYHNGQLIPSDSRHIFGNNFGFISLDIINLQTSDSGVYTCRAVNEAGEAITTATLRCYPRQQPTYTQQFSNASAAMPQLRAPPTVLPKPKFGKQLSNIDGAKEGHTAVFEAQIEPADDQLMKVEWFRNGQSIQMSERFEMKYMFGRAVLTIKQLRVEDSGVYMIKAHNGAGDIRSTATLKVEPQNRAPAGAMYNTGASYQNSSVNAEGLYRNSVNTMTTYERSSSGGTGNVAPRYDPSYDLYNAGGSAAYTTTKTVTSYNTSMTMTPTVPSFMKHLEPDYNVLEGSRLHMEVRAQPSQGQELEFTWLKNGEPIRSDHRVRTSFAEGYAAIDILTVYPEDAGVYTLRVRNPAGEAFTSTTLHCIPTPQPKPQRQQSYAESSLKVERQTSSSTTTNTSGTFLQQQQSFQLPQQPAVQPYFLQNHQPPKQPEQPKYQLPQKPIQPIYQAPPSPQPAPPSYQLPQKPAKPFYQEPVQPVYQQPQPKPNYQQDYIQPQAPVQPQAPGQSPMFTQPLKDVHTKQGTPVHLETRLIPVGDTTLTVLWYKDGQPLQAGARFKTTNDWGHVALDIIHSYPEDTGVYSCRAINATGEAVVNCTVSVTGEKKIVYESSTAANLDNIRRLEDWNASRDTGLKEVSTMNIPPKILKPLRPDYSMPETKNAHFELQIQGTDVEATWYKNGQPVMASNRIRTVCDFGYVALDIIGVRPDDAGEWTVVIKNKSGQVESRTRLSVLAEASMILGTDNPERLTELRRLEDKHMRSAHEIAASVERPQFRTPLHNMTNLVEMSSVHLETRLTPVNEPTQKVEWFHNGRPLLDGSRIKTVNDFGFVALDISNLHPSDSGHYMVKATNAAGEAMQTCQVQVRGEGGILSQPINAQSLPHIQRLEDTERGPYPIADQVVPTQAPRFLSQIKNLPDVHENAAAHFECRLEPLNDAQLTVEWYKDGQPLKASHRYKTTHDFGYVALHIIGAGAEDTGRYTVVARNKLGEVNQSADLMVRGSKLISFETQHPDAVQKIQELEAWQNASHRKPMAQEVPSTAPHFVRPLQSQLTQLPEGGKVNFEARLEGFDSETVVEWFHNGRPLAQGSRFRSVNDFGYVAMTISDLRAEDSGEYMIRAHNNKGEDMTSASIHVQSKKSLLTDTMHASSLGKIQALENNDAYRPERIEERPTVQKPVFTVPLRNLELTEGDKVHLESRLIPVGCKVEWFHNERPVDTGSRFGLTNDFGFVALDIANVRPEDSGTYACRAYNELGEAVATCSVLVRGTKSMYLETLHQEALPKLQALENWTPERRDEIETKYGRPVFTIPLPGSIEIQEGEPVRLHSQLVPVGDPTLKVEWFLNGQPLRTGSRFVHVNQFGHVGIDLSGANPEDSGLYTVRASNAAGEAVSSASVRCLGKAGLLTGTLHPESLPRIQQLEEVPFAPMAERDLDYGPPRFVTTLNSEENVKEHGVAHFECRLEPSRDPTLKVDWYLNGKPLLAANRSKLTQDFGFVALDLNQVTENDSGVYMARAYNKHGEAFTSGRLLCRGKAGLLTDTLHPESLPRIQQLEEVPYAPVVETEQEYGPPRFVTTLNSEENAKEHGVAHFECRLEPSRDPTLKVDWYLNGKPLLAANRSKLTQDFGFVALDLMQVTEDDSGVYMARAYNKHGEAFTSGRLVCRGSQGILSNTQTSDLALQKMAQLEAYQNATFTSESKYLQPDDAGMVPRFTSKPKDLMLKEGDVAHVHCNVTPTNDSGLQILWFKNGQPLPASSRIKSLNDFGFIVLEISGVQTEDTAQYVCIARNKYGEDRVTFTLQCSGSHGVLSNTQTSDLALQKMAQLEAYQNVTFTSESKFLQPDDAGTVPRFTSKPNDLTLKEGDVAHVHCNVTPTNDSSLQILWFKNGQPLPASTRIKSLNDFGFIVLEITGVQTEDTAQYVCIARNKYGEDRVTFTLQCSGKRSIYLDTQHPESLEKIRRLEEPGGPNIPEILDKPKSVPKILSPMRPLAVDENTSAHFETRITPTDDVDMKVEWFINGKPLLAGHRVRQINDFGFIALDILYVRREDFGTVTCRVRNSLGVDETSTQLSQLGAGPKQCPRFLSSIQNVPGAKEGDSIHLQANLEPANDPNLHVEWYWNGKPITHGSRVKTIHDFGFVVFEISPVYAEDSGTYTCVARNEAGEAVTTASINVEGKKGLIFDSQLPADMRDSSIQKIQQLESASLTTFIPDQTPVVPTTPPRFISTAHDVDAKEGGMAHFELRVEPTTDNTMRVEWFHNGKPIDIGSRFTRINDFGFIILEIKDVQGRDAGTYTCVARNELGEARSEVQLRVQTFKNIVYDSSHPASVRKLQELEQNIEMSHIAPVIQEQPDVLPRFTSQLTHHMDLVEGDTAHFEAKIEPTNSLVEWFRNGRPIVTGSRIRSINDFGFIVLEINGVTAEDSGTYTCRAKTSIGVSETSTDLKVTSKKSIILESQMPGGANMARLRELEMPNVQPAQEQPVIKQAPRFTTQLKQQVQAEEAGGIHIDCRVEPLDCQVEWYFNGRPLQSGHRFKMTNDFGYVSLDILYVYAEDSGEYVARAFNELGEDISRSHIVVTAKENVITKTQLPDGMEKGVERLDEIERELSTRGPIPYDAPDQKTQRSKPEFTVKPRPLNIEEGQPAKFECKVAGYPRPRVSWMLNGQLVITGSRFKISFDGLINTFEIPRARQYDGGEIVVIAQNAEGSATTTTTLTITTQSDYRTVLKHSTSTRDKVPVPDAFQARMDNVQREPEGWKSEQIELKSVHRQTNVQQPQQPIQIDLKPTPRSAPQQPQQPQQINLNATPRPAPQRQTSTEITIDFRQQQQQQQQQIKTPQSPATGRKPFGNQFNQNQNINITSSRTEQQTIEQQNFNSAQQVNLQQTQIQQPPTPPPKARPAPSPPAPVQAAPPWLRQGAVKPQVEQPSWVSPSPPPQTAQTQQNFSSTQQTTLQQQTTQITPQVPPILPRPQQQNQFQQEQNFSSTQQTTVQQQQQQNFNSSQQMNLQQTQVQQPPTPPPKARPAQSPPAPVGPSPPWLHKAAAKPEVEQPAWVTSQKAQSPQSLPPRSQNQQQSMQVSSGINQQMTIDSNQEQSIDISRKRIVQGQAQPPQVPIPTESQDLAMSASESEYTQRLQKGNLTEIRYVQQRETSESKRQSVQKVVAAGQGPPPADLQAPKFVQRLEPCRVSEGKSAHFTCRFTGKPIPRIEWYRENFQIVNSQDFQITTTSDTSSLFVPEVYLEDSGNFTVKAINDGGMSQSTANLIVEEAYSGESSGPTPPSFSDTVHDTKAKLGETVRLEARVHGSLPISVTWFKNGQKLQYNFRIKSARAEDLHQLVILNSTSEDSGWYDCVAVNEGGEARCSGQLTIEASTAPAAVAPPPVPKPTGAQISRPQIVQLPQDVTVYEGESATFRANISGTPQPEVKWYRGPNVVKNSKYFRTFVSGNICTLVITEAFHEDEGEYKCVARSPAGEVACTAHLKVLGESSSSVSTMRMVAFQSEQTQVVRSMATTFNTNH